MAVVSIGSAKSGGATTLTLALAGAYAAADRQVLILDASQGMDLATWSAKTGPVDGLEVLRCASSQILERAVALGVRRGSLVLIDAGTNPRTLLHAAECADTVLIPVRFSPLSAFAALATDVFLKTKLQDEDAKQIAFVATAIAQIPSRIARAVEERLSRSTTRRLGCGLGLRAAFEAPFLYGGTIFSLTDAQAPGLSRAREDAYTLAAALELFPARTAIAMDRIIQEAMAPRHVPSNSDYPGNAGLMRIAG